MRDVWLALAAGLLSWGLTGLVLLVAQRGEHVAMPTDRGLHSLPTPVGGGLGLIGAAASLWLLAHSPVSPEMTRILAAMAALATVSWLDDRWPLPPAIRFIAQAAVIGVTLWYLGPNVRLAPPLPIEVERVALGIAWLWLLNLTNFMDGIDGLAGVEAVAVGLGYTLIALLFPTNGPGIGVAHLPDLALLMAAAAAGYLIWNWAPASIFMGDVGSIPLGFVFGLLMIDLVLRGHWAAAIILPLYFLLDATATLLARVGRGVKPWQAHREHAYQRAVLSGMSHAQVSGHVAALNVALVALAVISVVQPWAALVAALLLTAGLFLWLRSRSPLNV